MENNDQESETRLAVQSQIVEAMRGFPIEASQQVWWYSSEFGEVSLKYIVVQYPGVDLSSYLLERKWLSEESGSRREKIVFNDQGAIVALERWKMPTRLSADLQTFTEELAHEIVIPDAQAYETLLKIITFPGEVRYDRQPFRREPHEQLVMPVETARTELAMDPEMQALKIRWLDEAARFNQNRGNDRDKDEKEKQRFMLWLLEMKRAGVIITDLEMIEAGMDPWSDE